MAPAPEEPCVDRAYHGEAVAIIAFCWVGHPVDGERIVDPIRSLPGLRPSSTRRRTARPAPDGVRDVAPPITDLVADQPASVQHEVWARVTAAWAPLETSDGTVRLPCTAVWAAATAGHAES